MAESAVMGLRIGLAASARSMMTTCEVSATFSRTQMNLSDSIVRVANPICCTLMPTFWSCDIKGGRRRREKRGGGGRKERKGRKERRREKKEEGEGKRGGGRMKTGKVCLFCDNNKQLKLAIGLAV